MARIAARICELAAVGDQWGGAGVMLRDALVTKAEMGLSMKIRGSMQNFHGAIVFDDSAYPSCNDGSLPVGKTVHQRVGEQIIALESTFQHVVKRYNAIY